MDILYLVVGRGGSKGVPRKNLQTVGGRSLVAYKAMAAKRSRYCGRLIVSSDDPAIETEAVRHGAECLFRRPAELASDTARSDDVVLHALKWMEANEGQSFEAVMLLEPSSPFATPDHLDAAVELFAERTADLVVGLRETEIASLFVGPLGEDGSIAPIVDRLLHAEDLRRQDQRPEVTMNGGLYLVRSATLRETGRIYARPQSTYGIVMDRLHSIEIEVPLDLAFARLVADKGMLDLSPWGGLGDDG